VDSVVTPAGATERVQVEPPSSVTMMEAECPPSSPTATHVAELADGGFGAHETARTFTSGAKLAVVCQWGVVAPAGKEGMRLPSTPVRARAVTVESAMTVSPRTVRTATSSTPGET